MEHDLFQIDAVSFESFDKNHKHALHINGCPSNRYPNSDYPSNGYPSNGCSSNGYPSNEYFSNGYIINDSPNNQDDVVKRNGRNSKKTHKNRAFQINFSNDNKDNLHNDNTSHNSLTNLDSHTIHKKQTFLDKKNEKRKIRTKKKEKENEQEIEKKDEGLSLHHFSSMKKAYSERHSTLHEIRNLKKTQHNMDNFDDSSNNNCGAGSDCGGGGVAIDTRCDCNGNTDFFNANVKDITRRSDNGNDDMGNSCCELSEVVSECLNEEEEKDNGDDGSSFWDGDDVFDGSKKPLHTKVLAFIITFYV